MSKKILFLLLVFMLTLTGCNTLPGPSEYADLGNTYHKGADFPIQFTAGGGIPSITPAEDGYFFFAGTQLYFFDKESLETTVFCNRPECQHQDEGCSAFFPRERYSFLQYYNGKLYIEVYEVTGSFTADTYLYEVDPVECTRKKICQLPYSYDAYAIYMMHRGYLYIASQISYIDEETQETRGIMRLERVALNELAEKSLAPEKIFETDSLGTPQNPFLYGEHLIWGSTVDTDSSATITMYDFHLPSNTFSELSFPDSEKGAFGIVQSSAKEGLLLTYVSPEIAAWESFATIYYQYDILKNEMVPLITFEDRGENMSNFLKWDGKQWFTIYMDTLGLPDNFAPNQEFCVLDENFDPVKRIPIDIYISGVAIGDEDFTFVGDQAVGNYLYAIDKRGDELKLIEIYKEDSAD